MKKIPLILLAILPLFCKAEELTADVSLTNQVVAQVGDYAIPTGMNADFMASYLYALMNYGLFFTSDAFAELPDGVLYPYSARSGSIDSVFHYVYPDVYNYALTEALYGWYYDLAGKSGFQNDDFRFDVRLRTGTQAEVQTFSPLVKIWENLIDVPGHESLRAIERNTWQAAFPYLVITNGSGYASIDAPFYVDGQLNQQLPLSNDSTATNEAHRLRENMEQTQRVLNGLKAQQAAEQAKAVSDSLGELEKQTGHLTNVLAGVQLGNERLKDIADAPNSTNTLTNRLLEEQLQLVRHIDNDLHGLAELMESLTGTMSNCCENVGGGLSDLSDNFGTFTNSFGNVGGGECGQCCYFGVSWSNWCENTSVQCPAASWDEYLDDWKNLYSRTTQGDERLQQVFGLMLTQTLLLEQVADVSNKIDRAEVKRRIGLFLNNATNSIPSYMDSIERNTDAVTNMVGSLNDLSQRIAMFQQSVDNFRDGFVGVFSNPPAKIVLLNLEYFDFKWEVETASYMSAMAFIRKISLLAFTFVFGWFICAYCVKWLVRVLLFIVEQLNKAV